MTGRHLQRRRWTILACVGVACLGFAIVAAASLWSPSSVDADVLVTGREMFVHEWQPGDPLAGEGDGLGPVFNARSCAECHFLGGVGGAGPNKHNVLAFEIEPTPQTPEEVLCGVVHASALDSEFRESRESVNEMFPIVKEGERVIGSCFVITRDFDPVRFDSVNTPALFGVGLLDQISDASIQRRARSRHWNAIGRELKGNFEGTPVGRARVLDNGKVGKFGWKGQFATLEEFVATACAVELGLSNPLRAQDEPCKYHCNEEAKLDMTQEQLDALVAYVADLPRPEQILPANEQERRIVHRGEQLFTEIGCADCHTPNVDGVDGVYSDFMLHSVTPPKDVGLYGRIERDIPPPDDHPQPQEWKTPPLWGVADSAPYFHDGKAPTIEAAILLHHGEAEQVRRKFQGLSDQERQAVIEFLKTLKAPQAAEEAPVREDEPVRLAENS